MDLVTFSASVAVGACLGALFFPVVHDWGLQRRIKSLETQLLTTKGAVGNQNRAANDAELEDAVGELMVSIQAGKPFQEAIKEVAAAHPMVAMRMLKKAGKGDLKNLLGGF